MKPARIGLALLMIAVAPGGEGAAAHIGREQALFPDLTGERRQPPPEGVERALYQYSHSAWGTREGLPQNAVQALLQTRDGYLWVGTQEGLVRFDGIQFRIFDRSNVPGMPHNDVMALIETPEGDLVVGTSVEGLFLFRRGITPVAERFIEGAGTYVTALAYAPDGALWVGTTGDGLSRIGLDGRRRRYGTGDGLASVNINALLVMPDGAVWAGTPEGLVLREAGTDRFRPVEPPGRVQVRALAAETDGTVWAGTSDGLYRLQGGQVTGRFTERHGLPGRRVLSLHAGGDGYLWIGTLGGLARLRGESISTFTTRYGLSGDRVISLLVDAEGSIWAGTDAAGLNQLRISRLTSYTTYHGLASDIVYCVAGSPDGRFWTGSAYGDIDRWTGSRFESVVTGDQLGYKRVRTMHEASDGALWIGTDDYLYAWREGELASFGVEHGLPEAPIRVLFEERGGRLLVGTDGAGLYRLRQGSFEPFPDPEGVIPGQIRGIIGDGGAGVWIGGYGALVHHQAGRFTAYTPEEGLAHDLVRTLHLAADGSLWIGTYGGGVSRLRDGRFLTLTSRHGLLTDALFQVVDDEAGDLWMSSNRGLFRVRREQVEAFAAGRIERVEIEAFDEADGMQNRECNGGNLGGWRSPVDGSIWFPTLAGMVRVESDRLTPSPFIPPLSWDAIVVDGAPRDPGAPLIVPPRPHRIEIQYTAHSLIGSERIRYRYRLLGYDTEWSEPTSSRSAHYTGLRPGSYRFEVTASNADGVWNPAGIAFDFRIQPAFYQAGWFYGMMLLGLALAVAGIVRRRTLAFERRERQLRVRVEEALAQVKTLKGMLPICSHCKKIRDDHGYWSQVEEYLGRHSQAEFSHGLCPACLQEHYPEFAGDVLRDTARLRPE